MYFIFFILIKPKKILKPKKINISKTKKIKIYTKQKKIFYSIKNYRYFLIY